MKKFSGITIRLAIALALVPALAAAAPRGKTATVNGYVLDSACAFVKDIKKPLSPECAVTCAKAGSPLAILTDAGTLYWPLAGDMPAKGQNERLLPFAGKHVMVEGEVFEKAGRMQL